MKSKFKCLIPLIFLFFFVFNLFLTFNHSLGATSTDLIYYTQNLQPVEGDWFYDGRDCYEDFQVYPDGAHLNLSVSAYTQKSLYGVQTINNSLTNILFDINRSTHPLLLHQNITDKNYLLYPNANPVSAYVSFNTNNYSHTQGSIEFMCYVIRNPTGVISPNNDMQFLIYSKSALLYGIKFYFSSNTVINIQNYVAGWVTKNSTTAYYEDSGGLYWALFHVIIDYTFNGEGVVNIYQASETETSNFTLVSSYTQTPVNTVTGSYYTKIYLQNKIQNTLGHICLLLGVDSSTITDYEYIPLNIRQYVLKSFVTNNVDDYFIFRIPKPNISMQNPSITKIEIKSLLSKDTFLNFLTDIKGILDFPITYNDIDDFTEISTDLYNSDTSMLHINTRYRCKTLNFFINVLTLRISWSFTYVEPGFLTLLVSTLPVLLTLLLPPSLTYIKFKRSGFLLVFFIMTLVVMATGMLPFYVGILMIILQVVILVKIMMKSKEEE